MTILQEQLSAHENTDEDSYSKKIWYRVCGAILVWFFVIFGLIIYIVFAVIPEFQSTIVRTNVGAIRGEYVHRFEKKIFVFKGVPYAKPPIGGLRFKPPQPLEPWRGLIYSDEKPACLQPKMSFLHKLADILMDNEIEQSEDCLYLNIFTPKLFLNTSNAKPVIVWFHGGGFVFGNSINLDGSILAAFGDVVVVTIAYRLGIFGFLNADNHILPGNAALYDQRLALEWISENIAYFGGDPNFITLFGEHSGAVSIGYHLITPESNRLFRRAIMHSGGPMAPLMMFQNRNNRDTFEALLNLTSCNRIRCGNLELDEILKYKINCLRQLDAKDLIEKQQILAKSKLGFYPTLDGNFFTKHPYELIESHNFGLQTELLMGTDHFTDSLHKFDAFERFSIFGNITGNIPENITGNQIVDKLRHFSSAHSPSIYRIIANKVMKEDKIISAANFSRRLTQMYNDFVYRCPDYYFVQHFTAESNRKVYYFQFESKSLNYLNSAIEQLKSPYQAFITGLTKYAFGYPLLNTKDLNQQEIKLTLKIMRQTTNFVKFGNPSRSSNWKPCTSSGLSYLSIGKHYSLMQQNTFTINNCEENFSDWYFMGKSVYLTQRNGTLNYQIS